MGGPFIKRLTLGEEIYSITGPEAIPIRGGAQAAQPAKTG